MHTDDLALLSLVQWLSPAFPIGAFAYSHGLEAAVLAGDVTDEASLLAWLQDILSHGAGWTDAVLMGCALRGEDLESLSCVARALAGSAERLRETEEQGAAFARARAEMTGQPICTNPMPLPLAVAHEAMNLRLPAERVIAVFEHGFLANLVSAGVRFIPLGQAAGQRVLAALHGPVVALAQRAAQAGLSDLMQGCFRAEMHAAAHETLEVRIFKT